MFLDPDHARLILIAYSIGITGLVVLGGHTSVEDPLRNFRNAFEGSSSASVYGATNAFVKVMFSYAGFENAFNVVNEVKVCLVFFRTKIQKLKCIEPDQNPKMERAALPRLNSNPLHLGKHRVLLSGKQTRDPEL